MTALTHDDRLRLLGVVIAMLGPHLWHHARVIEYQDHVLAREPRLSDLLRYATQAVHAQNDQDES